MGDPITAAWLDRKMAWSYETFGPGTRTDGVLDHISEEMEEVRKNPADTREWVDIILLAMDGAMRNGASGEGLIEAIHAKQNRNFQREWPDWRTQSPAHRIKAVKRDDE